MSNSTQDQKNMHLLPLQEKWINMDETEIKHLFRYYICALIVSLLWVLLSTAYHYVLSENGFPDIIGIYMFAFPSGVLGATIYYIRKLYKSCIQGLVADNQNDNDSEAKMRKIGAKMYFYLRPLISGILAILAGIAIVAGFFIVNNQPTINNEKFFLYIILISFYIGFCNGKIIFKMEQQSSEIVDTVFKENKDGK